MSGNSVGTDHRGIEHIRNCQFINELSSKFLLISNLHVGRFAQFIKKVWQRLQFQKPSNSFHLRS